MGYGVNVCGGADEIKKLKTLLIVLGVSLAISAAAYLTVIGIKFTFYVLCCAACVSLLYGFFFDKLIGKKWLNRCMIALCACFIVMVISLGVYGRKDNVTFGENAVIVLGAGIRGERVTRLLALRLDKAVEFSVSNPDAIIVVSGGQGPDEDISEALAMERYLVARGIPQERIIREDASTSTYENLSYSKAILDTLFDDPYEIAVITNDFHIFRAVRVAGRLGLTATHFHAATDRSSIPMNYSRECLAIVKFWIFGK